MPDLDLCRRQPIPAVNCLSRELGMQGLNPTWTAVSFDPVLLERVCGATPVLFTFIKGTIAAACPARNYPRRTKTKTSLHMCECAHQQTLWMMALQVPKKKLPSKKTLQQEIVQTLSGVNVLEFNIKMLMQHLSKPRILPSTRLASCLLPGPPPGSTPFNLSLSSVPSTCPFNLSFHPCLVGHGHRHAHLWSSLWLCRCHEVICPCSWSWSCLQLSCTTVAVLPVMWHSCIAACVITRTVTEREHGERVGSKRAE